MVFAPCRGERTTLVKKMNNMKENFETLIELRAHAMDRARCPYEGQQLRQLTDAAIARAESRRRVSTRRHSWLRYASVACVATLMGWSAYCVTPAHEEYTMRSTTSVASSHVAATVTNMIDHGMLA